MTEAVVSRATPKSLETRRRELQDMFLQEMEEFAEGIGSDVEHEHVEMVEGLGLPKEQAEKLIRELKAQWKKLRQDMAAQVAPVEEEAKPATNLPVPSQPVGVAKAEGRAIAGSWGRAQQVASWDDVIGQMNEQHAVIDNVGGRTMIACWEPSPLDPKRRINVFHTVGSFKLRHSNRFVTIEVPGRKVGSLDHRSVPLGEYWLGHRDRAQYRGVTFRPKGERVVDECLNIWQGWGLVPKAGDWGLIHWHMENVVAGGNAEFADYLMRWCAWAIQNPAAQAEVALVLIGPKGSGKGTLGRCLQRIFGPHAFQVTSREEVIGKFNGHLQDCILFIADEAYWGGDKRCVGRLQGMITEPTLPIERKGVVLFQVPNYLHVLMLAEPGWVIPAGRYERRYAAFAVSNAKRGEREYFNALHHQIGEGGAEAMMWDLALMPLGDWHPREIPESLLKSAALRDQQSHTLPPLEQWYLMLLHDAKLPGATKNPRWAWTQQLKVNAIERVPRLRFELGDVDLKTFLTNKERIGLVHVSEHKKFGNGYLFEPLADCRAAWERLYGAQRWEVVAEEWGGAAGGDEKRKMNRVTRVKAGEGTFFYVYRIKKIKFAPLHLLHSLHLLHQEKIIEIDI